MVFFANTPITIYDEVKDTVNKDAFKKPTKSLQVLGNAKGDVQPVSANEVMKEYGVSSTTSLKIYLPIGTNIMKTCKVVIHDPDYPGVWQVIGDPQVRKTLIPHKKIIVIKEEKPTTLPP